VLRRDLADERAMVAGNIKYHPVPRDVALQVSRDLTPNVVLGDDVVF
jgi:hypothetical protein